MNDLKTPPMAPDLTLGIAEAAIAEGAPLLGDVGGKSVLLARHSATLCPYPIRRIATLGVLFGVEYALLHKILDTLVGRL